MRTRARDYTTARRVCQVSKESQIEHRLTRGIKALGGRAYKFISPGNNGVPDRLVCLPGGRVLFVETKAPDGDLRTLQERQIGWLQSKGHRVYVLRNPTEVDLFLKWIRMEVIS